MKVSESTVTNLRNFGLLVLRLGVGGMMLVAHGVPKVSRLNEDPIRFADPIGVGVVPSLLLAIFAEVICALAVMAGAFTRLAAFPLLVTMVVAAFIVHADDPWAKKEFALLYAIPFATLMFTGGGAWSFDGQVRKVR